MAPPPNVPTGEDAMPYARSDPRAQLPDEFLNWPVDPEERVVQPRGLKGPGVTVKALPTSPGEMAGQGQGYKPEGWYAYDVMERRQSWHPASQQPLSPEESIVPPGGPAAGGGGRASSTGQVAEPGVDPKTVVGDEDRLWIRDTTVFPYSAVVRVFTTWPNGLTGGCSGSMIGARTVLTAAHCLYDLAQGGWATRVMVVPGLAQDYMPFGASMSMQLFVMTPWIDSGGTNGFEDMGAIALDRPLGNATSWFGRRVPLWGEYQDWVDMSGYPGDLPASRQAGLFQYYAAGQAWFDDLFSTDADAMAGQSGSGVKNLGSDYLFGVLTAALPEYNQGVPLYSTRQSIVNGWVNASNALPDTIPTNTSAGWRFLGGYTHHPVTSSARNNAADQVELFVVDVSGKVYTKEHAVASNTWTPCSTCWWTEWPGVSAGDEIAASSRQGTNTTDVVVRNPTGQIFYGNKIGTSLSSWVALGGDFVGRPLVFSRSKNGAWEVYVVAIENYSAVVKYRYWSDATWSWSSWAPVPWGNCAAMAIGGVRQDNNIRLFCADYQTGNVTTITRWLNDWSAPVSLGAWNQALGQVYLSPVVPPNGSRLDLFSVDTTPDRNPPNSWTNIRHNALGCGGGWCGWVDLAGRTQGRVTVSSRNGDMLNVFARGNDGRTWSNWWIPASGTWNGWNWVWNDDILEAPSVQIHGGGSKIYLTVRGRSHDVYERFYNGANWSN